ncbi:60S ribosomal protein L24 [Elasticomyces elasticus]|nr:60S ribosomal protein L24 [Elasticomyces elasticus]
MRTYDDTFSGQRIYPGKGKLFVRADSKIFRFQNGKTESLFLQRKNPRRIAWTVLCRRQRRKGISEEQAKSRRRKQVKSQRAVVGASLDVIKERRSQRPEARAAARSQATTAAKEKRAAAQSVKKAEKAKGAAKSAAGQSTGRQVKIYLGWCWIRTDYVIVWSASRQRRVRRPRSRLLPAKLEFWGVFYDDAVKQGISGRR